VELLSLCAISFLAGFVDSVVGGGGLIQLPGLFIFLPAPLSGSLATVFGTNKMASICGTTMAAIHYGRRIRMNRRVLFPTAVTALIFSFLGARAVSGVNTGAFKPVILVLLVAVAVYTYRRKDFGNLHAPRLDARRELMAGLLVGSGMGFYDGFFGPGTGSFLIFIFIGIFGFDFLAASATAKVVNVATNLSAVAYFAATDHILYRYALPMGLCNIAGSVTGARLAILKGNAFVRVFFIVVVSAIIARFGWELLRQ
jgi:hypothetical protein